MHLTKQIQKMEKNTNTKAQLDSLIVSYSSNIKSSILEQKKLGDVLEIIKSNDQIKNIVDKIRNLHTKEEREKLKLTLPYFNLGTFQNNRRNNQSFIQTQYMLFDLDKLEDVESVFNELKNDPKVFLAFRSPSGNGIKFAICLEEIINDHKQYSSIYKAIEVEHFGKFLDYFDKGAHDAARTCFISHDPDLYLNPDCEEIKVPLQITTEESPKKIIPSLNTNLNLQKAAKITEYLKDKEIDYADWARIGFALANYGEDGRKLFLSFKDNPFYNDSEKEINDKFDNFMATRRGEISDGSLFFIANKYGYKESEGRYFPFIERNTNSYAYYDTEDKTLSIGVNKTILEQVLKSENQSFPNQWDVLKLVYDPHNDLKIDKTKRVFNFFTPTEYMLLPKTTETIDLNIECPNILYLVSNLIPKPDERERFFNWFAGIMQTREKQLTAWVLKGKQGAGKNLFLTHVLKPLFGKDQAIQVEDEMLHNTFNGWIKNAFIVAFNEVAHDNSGRNSIKSKIKGIITETEIHINDKNDKVFKIDNYINCLFFSNEGVPILIEDDDRRFNVVTTGNNLRTQSWFSDPEAFLAAISGELEKFAQFLMNYSYDPILAKTVINNQEKEDLVSIGRNRYEEFAKHLKENDTDWFEENMQKASLGMQKMEFIPGKIKKDEVLSIFNEIYPDKKVTMVTLSKQLKIYGIEPQRLTNDEIGGRIQYFTWDSNHGKPGSGSSEPDLVKL